MMIFQGAHARAHVPSSHHRHLTQFSQGAAGGPASALRPSPSVPALLRLFRTDPAEPLLAAVLYIISSRHGPSRNGRIVPPIPVSFRCPATCRRRAAHARSSHFTITHSHYSYCTSASLTVSAFSSRRAGAAP